VEYASTGNEKGVVGVNKWRPIDWKKDVQLIPPGNYDV
jgi:hypothetical protein